MPFCPKCRYEYTDNVTICPDCGSTLTDTLEGDTTTYNHPVYYDKDEDYLNRLCEFLKENGVDNTSVTFSDEKNTFVLSTDTSSKNKATTLLNLYFEDELKQESEQSDINEDTASVSTASHAPYVKKSDKYKDLRSSGISLIIVGILGDIYIILNALSLTPIKFEGISSVLFYIVMGTLFNVFLIGGILSFRSACRIREDIGKEETLTEDILKYITSEFPTEMFEEKFKTSDENSIYFERTDFIRSEITKKFGELEESYLDNLIEQIYQTLFES